MTVAWLFAVVLLISSDFHTQESVEFDKGRCAKEETFNEHQWWYHFVDERSQRGIFGLIQADRKVAITQITNLYYHGEQKSILHQHVKLEADWLLQKMVEDHVGFLSSQ